jgi:hypothetical protein
MPENEANTVRLAANLAILEGLAENTIEAIHGWAVEFIESRRPLLEAWAKKASEDHWRWCVFMSHMTQGGRCLVCGTSKMIDVHHGLPRSEGGLDELDNLYLLCRRCHDRVTSATDGNWHWRGILPKLQAFRAAAMRAVDRQGWVARRDRTDEVERTVSLPTSPKVLALRTGRR